MESQIELLQSLVAHLQKEVDELKSGDTTSENLMSDDRRDSTETKWRELQQRVDKIEGNLGVDKIVLTDVGDKVQVTVQTPLGSVPVTLPHTSNTSKPPTRFGTIEPETVSTNSMVPIYQGAIKSGPPAGMTTEQLQDFKKQTLQINALQQKLKELENRLLDANGLIKHGENTMSDLTVKISDDVKEIYLYLDNINTTMSQKIANQRVEMEKLAGDTPQPINYDPFNYGEAYAGDVVDFEARKRIVQIDLLLQSLQTAMAQMKESIQVSPTIDLGYKVVRLDQLLEATGFGSAVRSGDITNDQGLVINQAAAIEPPEVRYPRREPFQRDDDQILSWSATDSIMQTLYRLEVELAQLQKMIPDRDNVSPISSKEKEGAKQSEKAGGRSLDETSIKQLVERECRLWLNASRKTPSNNPSDNHLGVTIAPSSDPNDRMVDWLIQGLRAHVKTLENRIDLIIRRARQRRNLGRNDLTKTPPRFQAAFSETFYKQPVRLRYLLQRVFRFGEVRPGTELYKVPRAVGPSYATPWPRTKTQPAEANEAESRAVAQLKLADIASLAEPVSQDYMIKGQDGRLYKGAESTVKTVNK